MNNATLPFTVTSFRYDKLTFFPPKYLHCTKNADVYLCLQVFLHDTVLVYTNSSAFRSIIPESAVLRPTISPRSSVSMIGGNLRHCSFRLFNVSYIVSVRTGDYHCRS